MEKRHTNWYKKFKAFGPGILMASAAIGGSHIVASTQAGALYGWQLAVIVILVNIFKYPFFRFGTQYTLERKLTFLSSLTPAAMASMINLLTTIVLVGSLAMLVFGGYKFWTALQNLSLFH